MALFYQHNINQFSNLGIWKIEENEAFFLEKVPDNPEVTHPYKRLQHLAGRYILCEIHPDFPMEEIKIAENRKPFLRNGAYHFSISHCGNYAAAIISSKTKVGIDLELVSPRIEKISPKFLNEQEIRYLESWKHLPQVYLQLLTILWCSKEAVFKWNGQRGIDFSEDIILQKIPRLMTTEWMKLEFTFRKIPGEVLHIHARLFDSLAITYVCQ